MDHKGLAQTRSRSKLDPATPDGQFHGQGLTKFDQPIGFPVSKLTRLRVAEFGRQRRRAAPGGPRGAPLLGALLRIRTFRDMRLVG